jgi:hypothetical protein
MVETAAAAEGSKKSNKEKELGIELQREAD